MATRDDGSGKKRPVAPKAGTTGGDDKREPVPQGGRFASAEDRAKVSSGGGVQQGGRFVSVEQREQQISDAITNAALDNNFNRIRSFGKAAGVSTSNLKKIFDESLSPNNLAFAFTKRKFDEFRKRNEAQAKRAAGRIANLERKIDREQAAKNLPGASSASTASKDRAIRQERINALQSQVNRERQNIERSLSDQFADFLKESDRVRQTKQFDKSAKKITSSVSPTSFQRGRPFQTDEVVQTRKKVPRTAGLAVVGAGTLENTFAKDESVRTSVKDPNAGQQVGLIGPRRPSQREFGFIPSPARDRTGFIVEVDRQKTPRPLNSPIEEFFVGISDPFVNLGRSVAAIPEGVKRDIEAGRIGAGDEFFQREIAPKLRPTPASDIFEGRVPDVSTPRRQGAAVGEGVLFFAPTLVGRAFSRTPKPIDPSKVIKNVKSETVRPQPQTGQVRLRPTNPFRDRLPPNDELFAADTATGFSSQRVPLGRGAATVTFGRTTIPLGTGTGKVIPRDGGLPSPPKFGNFPSRPPPSSRFTEPEIRPGDVFDPKTGLIQRTKQKPITKKKTVQKTKPAVEPSQRISSAEDILFGPKRKLTPQTKVKGRKKIQEVIPVEKIIAKPRGKGKGKQKEKDVAAALLPTQSRVRPTILDLIPSVAQTRAFNVAQTPRSPSLTKAKSVLRPRTDTTTATPPILRTPPQTARQIQQPFRPVRSPFRFRFPFFPPLGGGAGGGIAAKPKRGTKKFLASNVDPFRAGVVSAKGVPDIQVSFSSRVFGLVDKQLKKSRKKKGKKTDPLGQFGGKINI